MGIRRQYKLKMIGEFAILVLLAIIGWATLTHFKTSELLIDFISQNEALQMDRILSAFFCLGIIGLIYGYRRLVDTLRELGARQEAEKRAVWLAEHDMLTSFPNRRFLEKFQRDTHKNGRQKPHRSHAVYAIELDGFKTNNDANGHAGEDEALVTICTRLQTLENTILVVRSGDAQFMIIINADHVPRQIRFAEKVLSEISRPMTIDGVQTKIGGCIGIACQPEDGDTLEQVCNNADAAMYVARETGRSGICRFDEPMKQRLDQRRKLEVELVLAVENDGIAPHYQPLVSLDNRSLLGFEALARWTSSDGTAVSPDIFIPLAEELGLITRLSENLLRHACIDAVSWPTGLILSFNLSSSQFSDPLIGLRIVRQLAETGLPPSRLEIEVTETGLISDPEAATRILGDLSQAGVRLSLDDFGSGQSSLAQLARYNFNRIKIDSSFINQFKNDKKRNEIVRSIVSLGDALEIAISAEGVEEENQLSGLMELGCHFGQGYLFGAALSPQDALDLAMNGDDRIKAPGENFLRDNGKMFS